MKRLSLFATLALVACGPTVKTVTVEPGQAKMSTRGASLVLHARARDDKGGEVPDVQFAWSTSNPGVATVDGSGKVTAVKSGSATVSAMVGDVKGAANIQVQIPASLAIVPVQLTIDGPGHSAPLKLMAKDDAGNVIPSVPAIWSSSNPGVASVDNTGMVHALGGGTATVTARSLALTANAAVTVTVPKFDKIEVKPTAAKLKVGQTQQLTSTATDAGKPIAGVTTAWTVENPKIASVDAAGLLKALKKGKTTVTASAGGHKAEVKIVVK